MKNVLYLAHTINAHNAVKLGTIHAEARARGWSVVEYEFGWTAWSVAEIVTALKPDGIILDGARFVGDFDLRPLRKVPCVYLNTDFPAPPGNIAIHSDAAAIADMAADELLASAPREAVFFSLAPRKIWSKLRAARFRERMRQAGVPFQVLKRAEDIAGLASSSEDMHRHRTRSSTEVRQDAPSRSSRAKASSAGRHKERHKARGKASRKHRKRRG